MTIKLGVFGLGEAGSAIAADLAAAGADVRGYDPSPLPHPPGVLVCDEPSSAVADADVVIALTAAADAEAALTQALRDIPNGAQYADLSTASPALKRSLSDIAVEAELRFTDGALMSTVPGSGARTPLAVAGKTAEQFERTMRPYGMDIEVVGETPGIAATHKLLRSVTIKGLSAVIIESMKAAHIAGVPVGVWRNLVDEITAADEDFMRRLVLGTAKHATRRAHEMEAVHELLEELGVESTMTQATLSALRRVEATGELPDLPLTSERNE